MTSDKNVCSDMLTDHQRRLWQAYEAAEGRAPRTVKLQALNAFLDALAMSPQDDWFPWARSIAEQVVDHNLDLVVRRPLLERALFPALVAGYHAGLPGCARWLAGLSYHVPPCPGSEQLPGGGTNVALLRAALEHDPHDRRSRLRLIDKLANQLRYAIHEVPAGVLYGIDGATPQECLELEQGLDEFCRMVADEGLHDRHSDLINHCRLHFCGYRDYLLHREKYESYAAYLAKHQ